MKRTTVCLLTAAMALLGPTALLATEATAATGPITGQLVDRTTASPAKPVAGMDVRLRAIEPDGSPGALISTDITDASGNFELATGADESAEYYLRVMAGNYQGGWVALKDWDSTNNVETMLDPTFDGLDYSYAAGTALGAVTAMPAYFTGRVVNSKTGRPVANARVTGRDANEGLEIEGSDLSGTRGWFQVVGLTCEDSCYLKVNGARIGYETGFLNGHRIVPTWGAAAAAMPGPLGDVRLDRLP